MTRVRVIVEICCGEFPAPGQTSTWYAEVWIRPDSDQVGEDVVVDVVHTLAPHDVVPGQHVVHTPSSPHLTSSFESPNTTNTSVTSCTGCTRQSVHMNNFSIYICI